MKNNDDFDIYKAIYHSSPIGVAFVDFKGHILEANKALFNFLGYSQEELIGSSFKDITYPDDLQIDLEEFRSLVAGSIDHYQLNKRYVHKDGSIKWANLYVVLLKDENQNPYCIVGMVRDINETMKLQEKNKQLDEKLKLKSQKIDALHCIADFGYYEIDLKTNTWTGSKEFYHLFGFNNAEEPFDRAELQALMHPDDRPYVSEIYSSCINDHKPMIFECRYFHKLTGEIVYVNSYTIIEFENDVPTRLFGIKHNITKNKLLHNQLKDANKRLHEFVSVVSHDLKEPARGVIGVLGLLEKKTGDKLSEAEKELMKLATQSSKRLINIINSLLEYSRTAKVDEALQHVPIKKIIKESTVALDQLIKSSKTKIILPNKDIKVFCYPNLISRLLQNLISNSIKYKGDRDPVIEISLIEYETHYELNVKDNGIGIDPDFHDKIFTLFNRINVRRDEESNGIGLALCRKIALLHEGSIEVESKVGEGSLFKVKILKHLNSKVEI